MPGFIIKTKTSTMPLQRDQNFTLNVFSLLKCDFFFFFFFLLLGVGFSLEGGVGFFWRRCCFVFFFFFCFVLFCFFIFVSCLFGLLVYQFKLSSLSPERTASLA